MRNAEISDRSGGRIYIPRTIEPGYTAVELPNGRKFRLQCTFDSLVITPIGTDINIKRDGYPAITIMKPPLELQ